MARPEDTLEGGGTMGRLMRGFDWASTPLGPVDRWPQGLRAAVRIVLGSRFPMFIWWGRGLLNLYNDAYIPILGKRHPEALGRPAPEVWAEIWDVVGPQAREVLDEGRATWNEELLLLVERHGYPEETYFTFSYSPVPDDEGGVGGVFCACTEDTHRVLARRRLKTLREVASRTSEEATSVEQACQAAAGILADNPHDLPFALIYLIGPEGREARLAGASGLPAGSPAAPAAVALGPDRGVGGGGGGWPLGEVLESGRPATVEGLGGRFGRLPRGVWPEPPEAAIVLPIARPGQERLAGFLVAGLSPRRPLDDDYRGFLDLVAGHIATAVAGARAYEEERRRAEALAELDRAKTVFFGNVSHEFRTPLALLLGPLEELLAAPEGGDPAAARGLLEVAQRNALRLQRLVNTLLDFSRIEAGRVRASYQPTDLATLTAELASNFRSACEKAGLELVVDCPDMGEPVYVDRDMWEKVVLNLVSNAFKYTLAGRIEVSLAREPGHVALAVRDTGTGIPADQMPRLFERFQRVEGARGRTQEGSGIGLALVRELARLHGGEVRAESVPGAGSTFTVTIPLGSAHLPADRIGAPADHSPTAPRAAPFVEEALRWLPDAVAEDDDGAGDGDGDVIDGDGAAAPQRSRPRILLADDNADMREYVRRLLADRYDLRAVADGAAALEAARRDPPDLILTDAMMPGLDGFALLAALRAEPRTRELPILLLSARAGEEARVDGLRAGADDYLTKPFGAKELRARVEAHLSLARLRRTAVAALRESEDRFRSIFDQAVVGIAQTDLTGRFTRVNRRFCAIVGRDAAELYELKMQDITHPDDLARNLDLFRRLAGGVGDAFVIEKRYIRPDGSLAWVSNSVSLIRDRRGDPRHVVAVSMDVTEQRRAEEQRRRADERTRTVLESITDAFYTLDRDWRFTYVNRKAEELLGRGRDELLGKDVWEEFAPAAELEFYPAYHRAIAANVPENFEVYYPPHGRWYDVHAYPSHEGLAVYFRDVTGRRLAAEERERLVGELREADRRKDEFLAMLGHELRNPLAPIQNAVQVLKLPNATADDLAAVRGLIERQVQHLARLVDDLLDVSRIMRGKVDLRVEPLDLAAVVRRAVETARPAIDAQGHALTVSLPPGRLRLRGDRVRLAQVFGNLLNNAAKYTPPGGRIALEVRREGAEVVVAVRDNGSGIAPEVLPRVFDLFVQADRTLDRSQGGLGIGLTLVRRLVELHGGRVGAESPGVGLGSEFTVRLPLDAEAGDDERRPAGRPLAAAGAPGGARILVVDDNADNAESLAMLLQLKGHDVRVAEDGPGALAEAGCHRPDLILLDIGLPGMDGYQVAGLLRERPDMEGALIVAMTGYGQEDDLRRSRRAGFDGHLVKPVDPAALESLLASLPSRRPSPAVGPGTDDA